MGVHANIAVDTNKHIFDMKTLPLAVLIAIVLCDALVESRPNPGRRYYRRNSHYHQPRSYSSGSRGPNQFLKGVGTGKVVAGLGLAGYGLATNNNDFINAGGNLSVLGAGTKLLAHVFGKKKIGHVSSLLIFVAYNHFDNASRQKKMPYD